MASVRTSMIADTMAELDEAREGRREAECEKKREVDERVKLDGERMAELAKLRAELAEERKASHSTALSVAAGLNERLQDRIDRALELLDADTPQSFAKLRAILTGSESDEPGEDDLR